MTLLYGRPIELIYSMGASGSALANSASRTLLSQAASATTSTTCYLPPNTVNPGTGIAQAFKVVARGHVSTPGSGVPTLTLSIANDTSAGSFNAALGATAAVTLTTSLSSALWGMDLDCTITGTGTSGTVVCEGTWWVGPANSTTAATVYTLGSSTGATINTTVANYIEVWGQWGSAVASTSVTLDQLQVFGWN